MSKQNQTTFLETCMGRLRAVVVSVCDQSGTGNNGWIFVMWHIITHGLLCRVEQEFTTESTSFFSPRYAQRSWEVSNLRTALTRRNCFLPWLFVVFIWYHSFWHYRCARCRNNVCFFRNRYQARSGFCGRRNVCHNIYLLFPITMSMIKGVQHVSLDR